MLQPRPNESFHRSYQPQTLPEEQNVILSGAQPTKNPEFLQPVAYSPIPPQITKNSYQPTHENNETVMPSNAPPQRAPPPPPLKLPLTDPEETQSHKEPQSTKTPYSPQSESHQSKSSLDHELRQYQQYSERIHKLADSSVESLMSYGKPRAETERSPPKVEPDSPSKSRKVESGNKQNNHQEQANLLTKASGSHTRSEPNRRRENPENSTGSFSPSTPSISSGQRHSNTESSSSGTTTLLSPASLTTQLTPSQSVSQDNISSVQKSDESGNEARRKSNDSGHRHSANSHNSSCSLSEEESQLRSADAVPPHSIITRPNPKIISIVGNQRRSEPTKNLSPLVLQPRGHHSASALGFGGPSDWEHFGDYETEEIDDTDLYSRSKPKIVTNTVENAAKGAMDDAAELPVEFTPVEKEQKPPQPEQVRPDGNTVEPPHSTSQDIASVQVIKPEDCSEPPKPENGVESPRPEHNVEAPKDEHDDESSKLALNIESAKPETSVEPPRTGNDVESPRPGNVVESLKPEHGVKSFMPEESIESSNPEKASPGFEADNSENTDTKSHVESDLHGSMRPQGLQIKTEKEAPPCQSLDEDIIVKACSDDSTRVKAHECQPPTSPNIVDGEPSCHHSVKTLRENQTESPPSGDAPSDRPLGSQQMSQDDFLLSRLSSSPKTGPSLVEEMPAVSQPSQFQARSNGKIDSEDGKVSSLFIGNSSEVEKLNVSQVLPENKSISQGIDVTASSDGQNDGPKWDSRNAVAEESTTTIPFKASDPTNTDRSSNLLTLDHRESTLHQISPSKEVKPLRSTEIEDIYTDLDPWGKASLHRFILMLDDEAKAKTDLEKFKVFTVFANRESKLRAVLYAVDDDAAIIQSNLHKDGFKDLADPTAKRSEKALPALPPDNEHLDERVQKTSSEETIMEPGPETATMAEDVNISLMINTPSVSPLYSTEGSQPPPTEPKDESQTYSAPELKTPRERVNKVWTQFTSYIYPNQSSGSELPKIAEPENATEPQKPAYLSHTHDRNETEISNYLSKRQSAYRPYAALTMSSLDSGLCPVTEPNKGEGTTAESYVLEVQERDRRKDQSLKAVTSSSESSEVVKLSNNDRTVDNLDLRRFVNSDFDPLRSVLPSSGVIIQDSTELQELHGSMDAFPDDFGFIRESVLAWDAVAKKERECFERERHIRQGESERKIDELFDSHEIGYGDISELEAEFRQSEASRKADEDRHEYHTFLSSVFDVVWTQLHYEIDHLTPLYNKYMISIKDSLVGKDMFEVSTAQFTLAPLMSALLALHQKLEVRHQKAFEAVLERDRRLKRTEISAWYSLGNVSKVKELEKKFEGAEKNALVAYCQHRDERANRLMDVLDHNTLRGMEANQDYMECLRKAIRRVASGRASASLPSSDPGIGVEEVKKAKSITTALSTSSEQIVRTFHVADMLLNAADYELSVAKAKLANADAGTFRRLKEERTKEDRRLMRDLEHRLARIREDTRKTHDEVVKLLVFLGIEKTRSETTETSPEAVPLHETEELVRKALHNAKMIAAPEGAKD